MADGRQLREKLGVEAVCVGVGVGGRKAVQLHTGPILQE